MRADDRHPSSRRACGDGGTIAARRRRRGRGQGARLLGAGLDPLPARPRRDRERRLHHRPRARRVRRRRRSRRRSSATGRTTSSRTASTEHAAAGRPVDARSARRRSRTPVGRRRPFHDSCCILGADGQLGRDMFLRLLYGAQTSLEVAVFATLFTVSARRPASGLLAGYFRGSVDTVVLALTEIVMVFPVAALHHRRLASRSGDTLNTITFGVLAPGVFTLVADLRHLRLVLPGPHHPRRRPVAAREGVRRGGPDDGRERLAHHALAPAAAPRRADHRLLDADRRRATSSPRRASRSSASASSSRPRAGATCSRRRRTST